MNVAQHGLLWRGALFLPGLAVLSIGMAANMDDGAAARLAVTGASLALCGFLVGRESDDGILRRALLWVRALRPLSNEELWLAGLLLAFAVMGVGWFLGMDVRRPHRLLDLACIAATQTPLFVVYCWRGWRRGR